MYPELTELLDKLDGFQDFHAGIHDHDLAFEAPDVQKEDLDLDEKMRLAGDVRNAAGSQEVKKYYPKGIDLPNIPAPNRHPLTENPNQFQHPNRVPNQYPRILPKSDNTLSEGSSSLSEGKARIFGSSHTFIHPTKTGSYSENKWKKPEPPQPPTKKPEEIVSLISSEEDTSPIKKTDPKIYRADNIYTDSPYFNREKVDLVDTSVDENTKKRLFPNSPSVSRPENASKFVRRSKLNLDAQSDESDEDQEMELDIVGGAGDAHALATGNNDFEQSVLRPIRPSLNSTMAPTKRVSALIEEDLNESVSNMSIGEDEPFEIIEDSPLREQLARATSVLEQAETTQRMAPGEFKFDSFSISATSASQSQKSQRADSTMSGIVDLPKELDLKEQADEYDSDATPSSCSLQIDECTRIVEDFGSPERDQKKEVHELTTEEASNLLFGDSDDSDDSTDRPGRNTSGNVNVSDSQSVEKTSSFRQSFCVPETQQPPQNSGFFDSEADVSNASSAVAETTGEIIDDSEEEYNNS